MAKREFVKRLQEIILEPRSYSYKMQFTGPTGTNAVEAALKLMRKNTGRQHILYFSQAFHGMTLGALAITANPARRRGAGVPLNHSVEMPFNGEPAIESLVFIENYLKRCNSVTLPAAAIIETVQGEGGVNVADFNWLLDLETLLLKYDILLIVDDIQVGCGRTGTFFSFEPAGIRPDVICLSKSLSGYGLPLSMVLLKSELDAWSSEEHCGTFRGNNLAFVTASEALNYWKTEKNFFGLRWDFLVMLFKD